MKPIWSFCHCIFLLVWIMQLGCDRGPQLAKVQGKITYQGKALDHGMVSFFPVGGRPIGASILTDGTYAADLAPGMYEVIVVSPPKLPEGFKETDPLPPPDPNALPAKYNRTETSGLSVTVESGTGPQTFDMSLQ